jgi:hypothetical protein
MTAFWFATVAVALTVSVANLTTLLNQWWGSIQAAIAHMVVYGDEHDPPDRKKHPRHAYHWWGYRADLRHAGLRVERLTDEQRDEASIRCLQDGAAYPSECQPWGPYHQPYIAEVQKEQERWEREHYS